jgi:exopolysaccharide biosynthesis polyprenyl glycosylphosphotransferase
VRIIVPSSPYRRAGAVAPPTPVRHLGAEPVSFLVLLDVLSLSAAFLTAYLAAPIIKRLVMTGPQTIQAWALAFSPELRPAFGMRPIGEALWVLPVMAAATILFMQSVDGYRPLVWQSRTRLVLTSFLAPLIGLGTLTVILFALQSGRWSRLFLFLFALFSVLALASYRLLLRWYRDRRFASGYYARSIVFVGGSHALGRLATHIAATVARTRYDMLGFLGPSDAGPAPTYETQSGSLVLPRLGSVDDLPNLLVNRAIHEVIAVHGVGTEWLQQVIETCDYFRVTLRIVPEALVAGRYRDLEFLYHSDELRLPEIVLQPRDLSSTALFVKRVFDAIVSAALLVLLSPVFLLIALAIKLTTPRLAIFYPWRVVGYNGRRFTGYKFSTMVEDAESRRADLMSRNEMQGPVFKIRNDPRVTPLGKILRKYSLNELPQLWSVLKGDMSLVGPRPAFPHELERYELWQKRKLCVRPGITCLWQVRGRNRITSFDDWVRLDLEYIDNWSLWLDVKVLVWTALAVVRGTGW